MTLENLSTRAIGKLTITIGIVAIVSIVSLILFFIFGGFWGPLNDLTIAVFALMSAALVWMLHPFFVTQSPRLSYFMLITAIAGAVIVSIGSALVMSGTTSWQLAGGVNALGYAFIGIWLLAFNYYARLTDVFPKNLTRLGQISGALSALSLLNVLGIFGIVDAQSDASWLLYLAQFGGLGQILLLVWTVWLGRVVLKSTKEMQHG
jgi:hypothetical protein